MRAQAGWAALVIGIVWLYFDYKQDYKKAILAGYVMLGLIVGHIVLARSGN